MKELLVVFVRLGLVLILACCILLTISLWLYSYEEFTASLFIQIGQSSKLEKFRTLLLTRDRFALLKIVACISTIVAFAGLILLWHRTILIHHLSGRMAVYIKRHISRFKFHWQYLPVAAHSIILTYFALIALARLFFVFRFPFHVDERFTYLYFVNKGIAVSMAYYPGPNNHILYTLICNLFDIFMDDPILVMKVPALLIGFGLSFTFWVIVSRYFSYPLAIVATTLFSFADPVFYYSMQGRGYILLMFFVLIATHCALSITRRSTFSFSSFFWFWLSCTLGFYTIPIFVYPLMGLLVFISLQLLVQRRYILFKYLILSSLATLCSVLLLYMPVIIFNGWDALTGNSWVRPISWKEFTALFPEHVWQLASGLWSILPGGAWFTLLSIIFSLGVIVSKRDSPIEKQWMQLYIINLAVIVGMSFLQRLLLPIRVLFYLSIYQYIILALACSSVFQVFNNFSKILNYPKLKHTIYPEKFPYVKSVYKLILASLLSLVFASVNIYKFYYFTSPGQFSIYDSFDTTAQWLFRHNANNIFVNEYDYSLCIRFLYETSGRDILLDTYQPVSGREYFFLVIHSGHPYPAQIPLTRYNKVYSDEEVAIYQRGSKLNAE